jgi:ketosteroid isomerase-like protein
MGRRSVPDPDLDRRREVVDAFLAAARGGDFDALVGVLDPDVVLRADLGGGVTEEVRGAEAVASRAQAYSRLDLVIHRVLVNGAVGAVATRDGRPFSVGAVTVRDGKIVELDFLTDPARLAQLDLKVLDR